MYTCMSILGKRSVKGTFGTNRKISQFKVSRYDLIIIIDGANYNILAYTYPKVMYSCKKDDQLN